MQPGRQNRVCPGVILCAWAVAVPVAVDRAKTATLLRPAPTQSAVQLVATARSAVMPAAPAQVDSAAPASPEAAWMPSLERLLKQADLARRRGEVDQALALYARVLDRLPDNRVALYNTGILLENAGEMQEATGAWMRALGADPADLFAYVHLVRALSATAHLEELIGGEVAFLEERPEDEVHRLRLAIALQGAGRGAASVPHVERVLVDRPASNIAYMFLKDAFRSRDDWLAYVQDVGTRAASPGASPNLKLLHIRLLLERGRVTEAAALAGAVGAESDLARTLLARAGLLAAAGASGSGQTGVEEPGARNIPPGTGSSSETAGEPGVVTLAPPPAARDTPPDFGPDDPRSASLYLDQSRAALEARADSAAVDALRRALHASPLRLQPRMTLSLLLEQQGRTVEAREVLKGPVEVSPWDLYQQVWRTVRDEFHDPDHNGVDVYRWRERARGRVRTVNGAKREIVALLSVLGDRYARMFSPEVFARYLLAPNAPPSSRTGPVSGGRQRPWIDIPPEEFPEPTPRADERSAPARSDADDDRESNRPEEARSSPLERPGMPVIRLKEARSPGDRSAAAYYARDPKVRSAQYPVVSLVGATVPDPDARIGYVSVPSLAAIDVSRQVERALAHLKGVVGLILDLRGNRGGDAAHAVEVAAQFLPGGSPVATYITRRGGQLQVTRGEGPQRPAIPVAVLIDGTTASAAEMLAAALRDRGGAFLVGARTAGKGVGQKAVLLPDGSGLSLTRFQLRSPSGERWDETGLAPDVAADAMTDPDVVRVAATEIMRRLGAVP